MDTKIRKTQPAASKREEHYLKNRRRKNGLYSVLMFFVFVVAVIFVLSVILRVSEVQVIGNEHYTAEEIIKAIGIEEGDNIFFFDRFSAISRVFAKLPYVEEVSVERKLPGTVTIAVQECKAVAYISVGEEDWTIDPNCKVLGKAAEGEHEGLIPIIGFKPGTLLIGEKLKAANGDIDSVDYLADILDQLYERKMSSETRRVDVSDLNKVKILYGPKYSLIIGSHSNTEHKFGLILSTISQLKTGDVGTIDVSDNSTAYFTPN